MAGLKLFCTGRPFLGELRLDGGKHGFAHTLAVAALADQFVMYNVPNNIDSQTLLEVLSRIFQTFHYDLDKKILRCSHKRKFDEFVLERQLLKRSRSLFGLIPFLLRIAGKVIMEGEPKGCEIGERPSDWYLTILSHFGAKVSEEAGFISITWSEPQPAEIFFDYPTMTGTVIAVAAAACVPGRSLLRNCSVEPSCEEMCECVQSMGAMVSGKLPDIAISGGDFDIASWAVSSDRIHAVTYLTAGLLSKGKVTVHGERDLKIPKFISFLSAIGAIVEDNANSITVTYPVGNCLKSCDLHAGSEPLFSSDWIPFAALLMAIHSDSSSSFSDDVFLQRFQYSKNLEAFGLTNFSTKIAMKNGRKTVFAAVGPGVGELKAGNFGSCEDIRGSAALALASIVSNGPCKIENDFHIRRGYADFEGDLIKISGGSLTSVKD